MASIAIEIVSDFHGSLAWIATPKACSLRWAAHIRIASIDLPDHHLVACR